jgi:NADH dehydrogenase
MPDRKHVIIVGAGFAGIGCARELAGRDDFHVTLLDKNNYHQFQPLLYQVATSQLAPADIAFSLRGLFKKYDNVDIKLTTATAIDPVAHTVTADDGHVYEGDAVVLAAGSQPNFFKTPGADTNAFPLYSLADAEILRSRILTVFEDADRDESLIDRGALNFVIVGGGPTGVETAGSLADMVRDTMPSEYGDLPVSASQVHIVDHGSHLLAAFADSAHDYVAKVLSKRGVRIHMNTGATEIAPDRIALSDGTTIKTRCVIWGGGCKAPDVAGASGLPQGRGARIEVLPDLTVDGFPGVYAIGDVANIPGADGHPLPQLGSVAMQAGKRAGKNIVAEAEGKHVKPFHYFDKGIMAMIGRGAAIAEGPYHHELHGVIAFSAWLGVHAALMTGVRNRIDAFVDWGWEYFSGGRGQQVLDRSNAARIDWGEGSDEPLVASP